jgi:hypothetical protein
MQEICAFKLTGNDFEEDEEGGGDDGGEQVRQCTVLPLYALRMRILLSEQTTASRWPGIGH